MESRAAARDRPAAWIALGLLVALWLIHVGVNFAWLKVDTRPPYWDQAGHAIRTIYISRLPFLSNPPAAMWDLLTGSGYPPLVYVAAAPLACLFWPTADALTGVHALFLGILLLSTYGIASGFGGRGAGLLAAFIVSMYPMIYGLARHYLLDVPQVAMVALSLWLLMRADYFERRGAAIACGISLGLGMLTKWTFAVFVGGPLLMVIVRTLASGSRRRLINVILALATGAAVAAPWYALNLSALRAFLQMQSAFGRAEGDSVVGSWESWSYYLQGYVGAQVLLPFALAFAVGLLLLLRMRKFCYETALLLCWIVLPYLTLSLFVNKDVRFTLPYLPAMAVVTALGLVRIRLPSLRWGLIVTLALYAVFQFTGLSAGLSNRLPAGWLPFQVLVRIGPIRLPLYMEYVHIAGPPQVENWPTQAILDAIKSSGRIVPKAQPLTLMVLPDFPCFEVNGFAYQAVVDSLPVRVQTITGIVRVDNPRAQILASECGCQDRRAGANLYSPGGWPVHRGAGRSFQRIGPSVQVGGKIQIAGWLDRKAVSACAMMGRETGL